MGDQYSYLSLWSPSMSIYGKIMPPPPIQMLQSEQMVTYLTEEDTLQMQQYFDAIPGGQATYANFYPLAKELILRVYRVKDPSDVSRPCHRDSTTQTECVSYTKVV